MGLEYQDRRGGNPLLNPAATLATTVMQGEEGAHLSTRPIDGSDAPPHRFDLPPGRWLAKQWLDDDTLALADRTGLLWALDPRSGATRWRREVDEKADAWPSVVVAGSAVVTADARGRVSALRSSDGGAVWETELNLDKTPGLTAEDGAPVVLVRASRSGLSWFLDASTGRLIARQRHADEIKAASCSPDGRIVAIQVGNELVELYQTSTGARFRTIEGRLSWSGDLHFRSDRRLQLPMSTAFTGPYYLRSHDASAVRPGPLLRRAGVSTNLRRCPGTLRAVPVLPFPRADWIWAPPALCADEAL